jgi:hypothetical protein
VVTADVCDPELAIFFEASCGAEDLFINFAVQTGNVLAVSLNFFSHHNRSRTIGTIAMTNDDMMLFHED